MKLLNLAITSIVDASTGNSVKRRFDERLGSNDYNFEQFGPETRANSMPGVVGKFKSAFIQYIEDSKARAGESRDIAEVLQLNSRILKDIGLTSEDQQDLESGRITLKVLNARRNQYRNGTVGNHRPTRSSNLVGTNLLNIDSANQVQYEAIRCA